MQKMEEKNIPIHTSFIKPIEKLHVLPTHLSGKTGTNRNALGTKQIDADNDLQALNTWLGLYQQSPHTWRTYRKEIERLYLWCLQIRHKPFASLTVEDMQDYLQFLCDPTPCDYWCGPRVSRKDPHWKPFEGVLDTASQKQALIIIGSCFSFLVNAGYLSVNPVKLLNKSSYPKPYASAYVERYLDREIWQLFWQHLLQERPKNQRQQAHHERHIFIFSLLYLQSPRASEVVSHTMQSIRKQHGKWWWIVTGKGNQTKRIPWKDDSMYALMRYREFRGLSPYLSPDDTAPLVTTLNNERSISAGMLYKIVKKKVRSISAEMAHEHPQYARKLQLASPHWFRHTSLTHQADDGIDLRYLQAMARHESLETTQRYFHLEADQFHDSLNRKQEKNK